MTEKQLKELRKSANDLAKQCIEGFKVIQKENPDLDIWAQIALTEAWWRGYIAMGLKRGEKDA